MALMRQILLVCENGEIDRADVAYAINLACRMDCHLSVLMLVPLGVWTADQWDQHERALADTGDCIGKAGLCGHHETRQGDQASELLKYIALAPTIAAIVWGGDGGIITLRKRRKSDHWFEKVRPHIACPIVTPRSRGEK